MGRHPAPEELFAFPCDHIFKAFGPADPEQDFAAAVKAAVASVVPVGEDQLRQRTSREGTYVCISVVVRLQNFAQLEKIYAALRPLPGLRYLL